jgi:hypothetical protein
VFSENQWDDPAIKVAGENWKQLFHLRFGKFGQQLTVTPISLSAFIVLSFSQLAGDDGEKL